ncbi:uroporphyrinogen-III synthase [Variovorax arabinosiphilus]|uniref:uroporphyrinogen-III synthase n=1 Tax=Variovorax arabinosiphilus TaxID=3053498 RepID=UPI0025749A8C|nr:MULTISPECIES: uroporphyrinogen-III synthase [unclassified Variovorax]MDM0123127.1 uroporphyrinogen-III synthase [Variovorax sp. J2L1-78]MDM0131877.1 uroporphyrinogen-III synthase [Variovorax sp. J2L1-63]MDM0235890.1 uroporphyrinogen-III synthase [Variovorax sp. J2R1-6]
MNRRVIVTRPAHEASRWVDALNGAGLRAVALPLIAIEPLEDAGALAAARLAVVRQDALMFVSAAAASHFVDARVAADLAADPAPRCWATGPGTVRALQEAGVPASCIDAPGDDAAQFDSEALWAVVRPQVVAGTRVLIVRGGDVAGQPGGRDWLARTVQSAGGAVEVVAAYRRLAPIFGEAERRLAIQGATDGSVWLFSSSEGIANLCQAVPEIDWRSARAVATHPRIGEAARAAGFGTVALSQPGLAALAASIESFQ